MWSFILIPLLVSPLLTPGQESKNFIVRKIEFWGNSFFSDKRLKKEMITREKFWFKEENLLEDYERLSSLYHSYGFWEFVIKRRDFSFDQKRKQVSIRIEIEEGKQTVISSLRFEGNRTVSAKELRKVVPLKEGQPLNMKELSKAEFSILMLYADYGFIYAGVDHTILPLDVGKVELIFHLTEGQETYFGQIEVKGNQKTKEAVVRREFLIKEGESFSRKKLLDTQERIYQLGLFQDLEFIPSGLSKSGKAVNLVLALKERNSRWVGIGVGYGAYDRIRFSLEWGHRNIGGMAKRLNLKSSFGFQVWPSLKNVRRRFEAGLADPNFFYTTCGIITAYNEVERPPGNGYRWERTGGSLALSRKFGESGRVWMEGKQEWIGLGGETDSNSLGEMKKIKRSVSLTLEVENRDNILNPGEGVLSRSTFEYAGGFLGGDNHFIKFGSSFCCYKKFFDRAILAFRLRKGIVKELDPSEEVPLYERLFSGGANSVRGYKERELGPKDLQGFPSGGRFEILSNTEIRYPYDSKVSGAAFFDWGNVWMDYDELIWRNLRSSIGLGLRYQLPIGPLRVDYGIKLKREKGEEGGNFHLALGQIF